MTMMLLAFGKLDIIMFLIRPICLGIREKEDIGHMSRNALHRRWAMWTQYVSRK